MGVAYPVLSHPIVIVDEAQESISGLGEPPFSSIPNSQARFV
jgi:hypothetical protein